MMMDPHDRARRAAALAWHQAQQRQLDIPDHNELQQHVRRLAEQLSVPERTMRECVGTAALQASTSWKAGQLLNGMLFGT